MSQVVKRTEDYYDSKDADEFYFHIWGGEDIHVGLYKQDSQDIVTASRRTVERMAEKLEGLPGNTRVLDIGAGYGGAARYLAKEFGWQVTCLNLSTVQNDRNLGMTAEQGLAGLIEVVDGNFENLPFDQDSFDVVWSQDAILHSGDRFKVFQEVDRVLRPGGHFLFTDPMQKEDADPDALAPVLARIHLDTMGSIEDYNVFATQLGWDQLEIVRKDHQLIRHYSAVLRNLESRQEDLKQKISETYITNMMQGLRRWIDAGKTGQLAWGILHYRKVEAD